MKNMIMMIALAFGVIGVANAAGECHHKEKLACAKTCKGKSNVATCARSSSTAHSKPTCTCKPS